MALIHSWQQSRQQRREQIVQRQKEVASTLEALQHYRQEEASQLRNDLALFRDCLNSDVTAHRQDLQRYCIQLKHQTYTVLSKSRDRRQSQSQSAARELHTFRLELAAASEQLREMMQADLQTLKAETDLFLEESHQRRVQMRLQTCQDLAQFVEQLRSEVQFFLAEVEAERLDRAEAIAAMLTQREAERLAEFAALSERLKQFRSQIQQAVWGDEQIPQAASTSNAAAQKNMSQVSKPELKSVESKAEPIIQPIVKPIIQSNVETNASKGAKQLAKTLGAIAEPPKAASKIESKIESPAIAPKKPAPELNSHEEMIFQYIDLIKGARLTEIESALDISRFQAVEALRSLIQKGMITQRNRLYHVHEEFAS